MSERENDIYLACHMDGFASGVKHAERLCSVRLDELAQLIEQLKQLGRKLQHAIGSSGMCVTTCSDCGCDVVDYPEAATSFCARCMKSDLVNEEEQDNE